MSFLCVIIVIMESWSRLIVNLSGNIASGKSTLLQRISQGVPENEVAKKWDFIFIFEEPIHEWKEALDEFYHRFHFPLLCPNNKIDVVKKLQKTISKSYAKIYEEIVNINKHFSSSSILFIVERGPLDANQVFLPELFDELKESGLSRAHWLHSMRDIIKRNTLIHDIPRSEDPIEYLHLYLDVDPKICYERKLAQSKVDTGRAHEVTASFKLKQYLENLHVIELNRDTHDFDMHTTIKVTAETTVNELVDLFFGAIESEPYEHLPRITEMTLKYPTGLLVHGRKYKDESEKEICLRMKITRKNMHEID